MRRCWHFFGFDKKGKRLQLHFKLSLLMEVSAKFLLLSLLKGFQFQVPLFTRRTSWGSNSFTSELYTSWTRSEVSNSSCPTAVYSPFDEVSWVPGIPPITLGGERNLARLSGICPPAFHHTCPGPHLACESPVPDTELRSLVLDLTRPSLEHGSSLRPRCPCTPWRTALMSCF